jgi:serine/threonine-protein kinase RsbW
VATQLAEAGDGFYDDGGRSRTVLEEGMASDPPPLVLSIPSALCHVAQVRESVLEACRNGGLAARDAQGFALAVHEAITNVIRHAHQACPEALLEVHCYCRADRIEVHILDEGEPFDVTAVPHLDPAELRVGGRGVYLMRALADEIICERRSERGNLLRLVKLKRICTGG